MTGFDIFAIALVLLVVATLLAGIKTVPQGFDWTIERFGKYTRTMAPGLNIIIPYFDRVGRKMAMEVQRVEPRQPLETGDAACRVVRAAERRRVDVESGETVDELSARFHRQHVGLVLKAIPRPDIAERHAHRPSVTAARFQVTVCYKGKDCAESAVRARVLAASRSPSNSLLLGSTAPKAARPF